MEEVKEENVAKNGVDTIETNHISSSDNKNEEGKVDNGGNKPEPSGGTGEIANAEKSKEEEEKAEVREEPTTVDTMDCSEAKDGGGDNEQDKTLSPKKDPNIGKIVESNKILPSGHMYPLQGRVVSYQEPSGRFPPRWSVHWETTENVTFENEWMLHDLEPPADTKPVTMQGKPPLNTVQERYQQHVEHVLESNNLLSRLLLIAALEDALQTNLQLIVRACTLYPRLRETTTTTTRYIVIRVYVLTLKRKSRVKARC